MKQLFVIFTERIFIRGSTCSGHVVPSLLHQAEHIGKTKAEKKEPGVLNLTDREATSD